MKNKIILLLLFITFESLNLLFAQHEQSQVSPILCLQEGGGREFGKRSIFPIFLLKSNAKLNPNPDFSIATLEKPQLQMDSKIVEEIQEGIEGLITQEKTKTSLTKLSPITNSNNNAAEKLIVGEAKSVNSIESDNFESVVREEHSTVFSSSLSSQYKIQAVQLLHNNSDRENHSTKIMALSVCCDKWLAETRCITEPNQILSDYLIDVIQRGANHKLVKDFEKYWSYVLKARELGDAPLALGWIQVAEDIQQAIEDNIKVAAVKQNNKDNRLSSLWQKSAQSTLKLAQNREKCIKAGMFSETPEVVSGWKNIVKGSGIIADYFREAATAYALRKPEYNRFNIAAIFMERSVSGLEEAVNILKMNAASMEERDETLALWEKIVQQYKDTAKYYYQIANAIVGEFHLKEQVINNKSIDENLTFKRLDLVADPLDYSNELFVKTGYDRLNGITTFAEESTSQLKKATALLKQATKEGETNLKEFANLRIKIAEQYQKLFEYVCQTASILSSGNEVDNNYFQQANIFIENSVTFLEKASIQLYNATRAKKSERIELAELWFITAKQNQEAAVYEFQTANNCLSGNVIDSSRIEQAKELSKNSEDPLEQAAIKLEKHLDSEALSRYFNLTPPIINVQETCDGLPQVGSSLL